MAAPLPVAWAAAILRPFHDALLPNIAVGVLLGAAVIFIETRLRQAEVTNLLGALIGGAIGLGLAKTISAALFFVDATDSRVGFFHSFLLLVFPYLGIVMGAISAVDDWTHFNGQDVAGKLSTLNSTLGTGNDVLSLAVHTFVRLGTEAATNAAEGSAAAAGSARA